MPFTNGNTLPRATGGRGRGKGNQRGLTCGLSLAAPQAGAAVLGTQVPTLTGETRLSHGSGLATVLVRPLGHYS